MIYDNMKYWESFDFLVCMLVLKWLYLYVVYDDIYLWEVLEIVCMLMGLEFLVDDVVYLVECIKCSYISMILLGD